MYSIALDESTDSSSTAELVIFVKGVDADIEITEEMIGLMPLKGTTTASDIVETTEECLESKALVVHKMYSLDTDGAPVMTGRLNGKNNNLITKMTKLL